MLFKYVYLFNNSILKASNFPCLSLNCLHDDTKSLVASNVVCSPFILSEYGLNIKTRDIILYADRTSVQL